MPDIFSVIGQFKSVKSALKRPFTSAVITVGGKGTRFISKDGKTKQFAELCGMPVIARTLKIFQESPYADEIIVVANEDEIEEYTSLIDSFGLSKVSRVVKGGKTRQKSVLNGFKAISEKAKFVMIHDGVRCLITQENIKQLCKAAFATGVSCAVSKCHDTLKLKKAGGYIDQTIDRDAILCAQTPQVFETNIYRAVAFSAEKENIQATDDCSLAEYYGFSVKTVDCGRTNIKITEKEDLAIAKAILEERNGGTSENMKIGHGYDVHRFTEGRKLILGGIEIPYEKGLDGHSDADVLLHAIMDSVIGALGEGDIGKHFPDTDKKYRGISSTKLAKETQKMLETAGYYVSNIDATVVMQAPKISPYIEKMRKTIADIYKTDINNVNVKATTEEKLGFTGSGDGASAHSVCLISKAY